MPYLAVVVLALLWSPGLIAALSENAHSNFDAASCQGAFAVPSVHCAPAPQPFLADDGRLWLSFASHGHVYVTYSDDLGKHFSPPVAVNSVPEPIYGDRENRPKLALGSKGEVYVSWTRKLPGKFTGEVRFARSTDGGQRFDAPVAVIDQALTSHRFDTLSVDAQGRVYLMWIDKRDQFEARAEGRPYPGAAIYYAVSSDGGQSFSRNIKLADNGCECCRMRLANHPNGHTVALWRHVFDGFQRDHALAELDGERIVTPLTRLSHDAWEITACPHHGPDVTLDGNGDLHAVWFQGGGLRPGLSYGRFNLSDQALQQQALIDGSAQASHPRIAVAGQRLVRAWRLLTDAGMDVLVQVSADNGASWSEPQVAASTVGEADQMFLLAHKNQVFLSWRTAQEGYRLLALLAPSPSQEVL